MCRSCADLRLTRPRSFHCRNVCAGLLLHVMLRCGSRSLDSGVGHVVLPLSRGLAVGLGGALLASLDRLVRSLFIANYCLLQR